MTAAVASCTFAPDGGALVTLSEDGSMCVWSTSDWSLLRHFGSHTRHSGRVVRSCTFAPDGSTLVALVRCTLKPRTQSTVKLVVYADDK
eukprot:4329477-Pyramimonas_sp.AAC.3